MVEEDALVGAGNKGAGSEMNLVLSLVVEARSQVDRRESLVESTDSAVASSVPRIKSTRSLDESTRSVGVTLGDPVGTTSAEDQSVLCADAR